MRTLILLLLFLGAPAFGTTITDTLYTPSGDLWAGKIVVECPNGVDATGKTIRRTPKTYNIVAGAFTATLDPGNAGSPTGRTCTATYWPASGRSWSETWYVTTSAIALKISDISPAATASPNVMYLPAQISTTAANNGKYMCTDAGVAKWCTALPGSGMTDPTTTRGDLIYHGASGTTRLALGSGCLQSNGTDAYWGTCPGGTTDHAALSHLAYADSGHTGFQSTISGAPSTWPSFGDAALKNTGTGSGTVAAGNDSRLSDARTPTAHSHAESDVTNLATDLAGKEPAITAGTSAQVWTGAKSWLNISSLSIAWSQLTGIPTCSEGQIRKVVSGAWACASDETGSAGGGITSLNSLTGSAQTFAKVDDTNVTLSIGSASSVHTWTLGWTGTLAKSRQHANTLYSDGSYSDPSAFTFSRIGGRLTGFGTAAGADTGVGAANVILGNDARLTDSRAPTSHASSHATGQADAISPASIGAEPANSNIQAHISSTSNPHSVTAAQVPNTPAGSIAATDVQAALNELDSEKESTAALATWAGTTNLTVLGTIATGVWHGTAIADTYIASAATWNAKQAAITGAPGTWPTFATVATSGSYADLSSRPTIPSASSATPLMDGTAAAGTAAPFAREDHRHPTDTSREPALGNPAADNYVLRSTAAGVRSWVAQGASHTQNTDTGTTSATFCFNTSGPCVKIVSGVVQFVTDSAGATLADIKAKSLEAGDGTVAGELSAKELATNGTNYFSWLAPDSLTATLRARLPNAVPTDGQVLAFGVPSDSISQLSFVSPQPLNANLTQLGGLSCAALKIPKRNSGNTAWECADDATASGGTGDASTNTSTSVDSEVALFSGTDGKTLKRATLTAGVVKSASGVLGAAAASDMPSGVTLTIASGTASLGTSAIASAACASVVSVAGTGIATTDAITASFNGDPSGVTGYVPLTAGMLTILVYPTSGYANFKVCNNTSASITPGAITLNWRVVR